MDNKEYMHAIRHSAAHVLATAIKHLYRGAKFGVGPVIENGFYYDIDLGDVLISEADLKSIEKEMKKVIAENQMFVKSVCPIDEAIKWAKDNGQPYKLELLNDLKRAGTTEIKGIDPEELGTEAADTSKVGTVSFYTNGDFKDLCRGPHVESTGKIKAFKLDRVSGAYWRGDEKNKQLQRVYGVAFENKEELEKYVLSVEEAKKRDHRKLGQELDLFLISNLVGPGLPLFTPRGTVLRDELIKYSEELQISRGYQKVWAPHMAKVDLYKKSGHFDKYPERFDVSSVESEDKFMMKPMNCPHVIQIYASKPRSYRDLPIRYMETTTMYRDEKSGELHGLSRVRSITQDDAHVFVRHDQIRQEISSIISMVKEMYLTLDMALHVELSFRDDSDKYFGDIKLWEDAENVIEDIAKKEDLDYVIIRGEAAFYGPKIDIHIKDALGRSWQCATIQLDYVMPERFDIYYTNENGEKDRPAIVHKAILGSIERFLAVYIEHTAGKFPVWLAPEQLRIITLNQSEKIEEYSQGTLEKANDLNVRASIDNSNESVGKKIRNAELMKIPYIIVIGNVETETNQVTPRIRKDLRDGSDELTMPVGDLLAIIHRDHADRAIKSSL